jgi:hypothetical protein
VTIFGQPGGRNGCGGDRRHVRIELRPKAMNRRKADLAGHAQVRQQHVGMMVFEHPYST